MSYHDWINVIKWCLLLRFYPKEHKSRRNILKTGRQLIIQGLLKEKARFCIYSFKNLGWVGQFSPATLDPTAWNSFFFLKFISYLIPIPSLSKDIDFIERVPVEILILCQPRSSQCNQEIVTVTLFFFSKPFLLFDISSTKNFFC